MVDPAARSRRAAIRERALQAALKLREQPPPGRHSAPAEPVSSAFASYPAPQVPSLPLGGQIRLDGFDSAVEIVTDRSGVPHVLALTEPDLYRAQGLLHFAERGWQVEIATRSGQGTLAELVGPLALASDSLAHRLGLPALIESAAASVPGEVRQVMTWYAQGAQAALDLIPTTAEHVALGVQPSRTSAEKVLLGAIAIFLVMGRALQHDYLFDLLQATLADTAVDEPDSGPQPTRLLSAVRVRLGRSAATGGRGSNAWAVAGGRCAAGGPVLACDPHLEQRLPGHWMAMHLTGPNIDVIGATLPGIPDVIFGHNGKVAWATTFAPARNTRLTLERIADDGDSVQRPDGREPVSRSFHEVAVAGQDSVPVEKASTSTGALLGLDVRDRQGVRYDIAIDCDWWAEPYPEQVIASVNRSTSAVELTTALMDWHSFPQTVVYADTTGGVGTVEVGWRGMRCPVGRLRRGWLREDVPEPPDNRHHVHSGEDIVVAANAVPPVPESGHWEAPLREARILSLLSAGPCVIFEQSALVQLDLWSPLSGLLLGELTDAITGDISNEEAEVLTRLRRWHGRAHRDIPEPVVFMTWLQAVAKRSAAPAGEEAARMFVESKAWLTDWGLTRVTEWVRDRAAHDRGRREITATFQSVLQALKARLGPDPQAWSADRWHVCTYRHPLDGHPAWRGAPLRAFLPGADDTVCRGDGNLDPAVGPTFRMIVDLSKPDESVWAFPVGNSGVPSSPHHHDLLSDWAEGRYRKMPFSRAAVRRAEASTLSIIPSESARAGATQEQG